MDFERIGRTRLMMRLPQHREFISKGSFLALTNLLEAYGRTCVKRDETRSKQNDSRLLEDYERECLALEECARLMLAHVSRR